MNKKVLFVCLMQSVIVFGASQSWLHVKRRWLPPEYAFNLRPGVSDRWNSKQQDLSDLDKILKELYEDYLNGKPEALQQLLSDSDISSDEIRAPFTNSFIAKMRGWSPEQILLMDEEDRVRTELQQEYEQAVREAKLLKERVQYIQDQNSECSVCLEACALNDKVFNKNCRHFVCKNCIGTMMQHGKNFCPNCKSSWETL